MTSPKTLAGHAGVALVAAAVALLTGMSAAVAAPAPSVRAQVESGTLLADHGLRRTCALCEGEIVTVAPGSNVPLSAAAPEGYGPSDLAAAYKITGPSTSTATIAIIDAGVDGNLAADLATYRKAFALPACTTANGCLTLENYTGGKQPAPQNSGNGASDEEDLAEETSLDVDLASAACPSCKILELSVPYLAGEENTTHSMDEVSTAVGTAIKAGAKAISISYGYQATKAAASGTDLAAFDHAGVAIEASTGDDGFNGGTHALWPSDLPYVIGVGGTTLTRKSGRYSETAWGTTSSIGSAGSGCETWFPAANGQPAAITKNCDGHLAVAAVSADADPDTGLAVYDSYAPYSHSPDDWTIIGGTSASSPYVAGLFARAGFAPVLKGPNTLYAAAASNFNDVTKGNNEYEDKCAAYQNVTKVLCNAGKGWDGPTGLGSPHGLGAF